jgi:hypothetical protein
MNVPAIPSQNKAVKPPSPNDERYHPVSPGLTISSHDETRGAAIVNLLNAWASGEHSTAAVGEWQRSQVVHFLTGQQLRRLGGQ